MATPHDAIFKKVFSDPLAAAAELQAVVPKEAARDVDWSRLELTDIKLVDDKLKEKYSDLLFRAPVAGQDGFVFVLFEHQSEEDRSMLLRMADYLLRIWRGWRTEENRDQPLPPILPVVLSHDESGWRSPSHFQSLFALPDDSPLLRFVPRFEVVVDDVRKVDDDALRARNLPRDVAVTLWLLRDARSPERLLTTLATWGPELDRVVVGDSGLRVALVRYILEVAGQLVFQEMMTRLAEVAPKAGETMISIAEHLRQEGRAEGRAEGARETLRKLLMRDFGPLSETVHARLDTASPAQLDRWTERFASTRNQRIEDVLAD